MTWRPDIKSAKFLPATSIPQHRGLIEAEARPSFLACRRGKPDPRRLARNGLQTNETHILDITRFTSCPSQIGRHTTPTRNKRISQDQAETALITSTR